jgi:hypothetical protein
MSTSQNVDKTIATLAYYCAEINTLCLGGVALEATALWVQSSLAEVQFAQGDPLSQPICSVNDPLAEPTLSHMCARLKSSTFRERHWSHCFVNY